MILREARTEDAYSVSAVHVHSRQLAYADFLPAGELDLPLDAYATLWRDRIQETARRVTFVGEVDRAVIGFIRFGHGERPPGPDYGVLEFIYLDPGYWDRGLGKQLLATAELELSARGFPFAYLAVYEANQRGRAFYERNGWTSDGTRWEIDRGGPVTQIRYVKKLTAG